MCRSAVPTVTCVWGWTATILSAPCNCGGQKATCVHLVASPYIGIKILMWDFVPDVHMRALYVQMASGRTERLSQGIAQVCSSDLPQSLVSSHQCVREHPLSIS